MKYGIMGGIVIDAFVSTSFEFNGNTENRFQDEKV